MWKSRSFRLSRFRQGADVKAIKKLIRELWLVTDDIAPHQIRSYKGHLKECRKIKGDNRIASDKVPDVLGLCEQVNGSISLALDKTHDRVGIYCAAHPTQHQVQDGAIRQAIAFVVRLCFFVQLDSELRRGALSIKMGLQEAIAAATSSGPDRILKDDFCEKNMTRRTDIRFRYTSILTEHLELRDNLLFVFRHGSALKAYTSDSTMNGAYPPGFLLETQATIDLLFPVDENKFERRRRKLSEKNCIDLEIGDLGTKTGEPDRQLSKYQYWGRRLAIVDDKFQSSKPGRLEQWYYDRRDASSFATFWITFSAVVLAIMFGLISSVTGIMQTWKVYHPSNDR